MRSKMFSSVHCKLLGNINIPSVRVNKSQKLAKNVFYAQTRFYA